MPSDSEYVVLSGLEWDTEYNVYVVAENRQGKSQPAAMSFRTSTQPEAIPGTPPPQVTNWDEDRQQKTAEPNSKLKIRASHSIFNCLALKGEWQLNKSTEKIDFLDGDEPEMIFRLNFPYFKVLTARAKWAWVCARRTGTGSFHRGRNDFLWITVVLLLLCFLFKYVAARIDSLSLCGSSL